MQDLFGNIHRSVRQIVHSKCSSASRQHLKPAHSACAPCFSERKAVIDSICAPDMQYSHGKGSVEILLGQVNSNIAVHEGRMFENKSTK